MARTGSSTPRPRRRRRGIAIVSRRSPIGDVDASWEEFVPGRFAMLTLAAGGGRAGCTLAVVHHRDVDAAGLRHASGRMRVAAAVAEAPPQQWFFGVMGDFSFSAPGETVLTAATGHAAAAFGPHPFVDILGGLTELHQESPTRVAESAAGGIARICHYARSDSLCLSGRDRARGDPQGLGLRKHLGPWRAQHAHRRQAPAAARLAAIACTALYADRLAELERAIPLGSGYPVEDLRRQKSLIFGRLGAEAEEIACPRSVEHCGPSRLGARDRGRRRSACGHACASAPGHAADGRTRRRRPVKPR